MKGNQDEHVDLLNFYKDRGRNDARELGFMDYEGGLEPVLVAAYENEFEKTIKEIVDNERT